MSIEANYKVNDNVYVVNTISKVRKNRKTIIAQKNYKKKASWLYNVKLLRF